MWVGARHAVACCGSNMKARDIGWAIFAWSATVGLALVWLLWSVLMLVGGLTSVVTWLLGQLALPAAGLLALPVLIVVAVLDPRRRWIQIAGGLLALFALIPLLQMFGLWTPAYPSALVDTTPHATVRVPLDGPVVVGWGGDTADVNYHVMAPDQRWAYDLLVEPAGHGSPDLESYGCYGLPVLAPADSTVAKVHIGEADQDPSTYVPVFDQPAGNWVALELDTGTYLILAHLKPGSVAVGAGDTVREGQALGACGNSGNTSEPHVHVHHQRQFPEVFGVAEGLPLFFRDHDGPLMPEGGMEVDGDKAVFVGDRIRHVGASP